jgi:hypothetical protein
MIAGKIAMPVSELDTYRLAFDQASKSLGAQVATVDNARARIGVLMGSGNLATAFLGKDALGHAMAAGSPNIIFWFGAGAFVAFSIACIWTLWPSENWVFDLSPKAIIERHAREVPETIESTYRYLAEWLEYYFDANVIRLERLFTAMRVASVLIVLELAAFLALEGGAVWTI